MTATEEEKRAGHKVMMREKIRHVGGKINAIGDVSALCFVKPRAINLAMAGWVLQAKYATCKKCLAILKERGIDIATHSCF